MSSAIYGLCAAVALLCAYLLIAAYARQRHRLLLWSAICFIGFTMNNVLLVFDKLIYLEVDLSHYRTMVALSSVLILLYGLIWDSN